MSTDASNITNSALSLPFAERFELANKLWESVVPPDVWSIDDPRFATELQRRILSLEAGETSAEDWEVVRQRLLKRLRDG